MNLTKYFKDAATFDAVEKTAISVRDGVLEYLGAEIGMNPPSRVFKIYRSPATIANAAMKMPGIPVTNDHVSMENGPPESVDGSVLSSEMVDLVDEITATTIAVKSRMALSDTMLSNIAAGRRELSLGYNATLVPLDDDAGFDFELVDIEPHHLAAVEYGRCGSICSFLDRKLGGKSMPKKFIDADGEMGESSESKSEPQDDMLSIQQIIELATALPGAIRSVPVDQLQELIPYLKALIESAKSVMPAEENSNESVEEASSDPSEPPVEEEMPSSGAPKEGFPEGQGADPADNPKPASEKEFTDTKAFRDAVGVRIKHHMTVVEKARGFLPETYSFSDKSTVQIMRDTLAAHTTQKFTDAETPVAFRLLEKTQSRYQKFGDSQVKTFTSIGNQEM